MKDRRILVNLKGPKEVIKAEAKDAGVDAKDAGVEEENPQVAVAEILQKEE
jgi:hypothetical protein